MRNAQSNKGVASFAAGAFKDGDESSFCRILRVRSAFLRMAGRCWKFVRGQAGQAEPLAARLRRLRRGFRALGGFVGALRERCRRSGSGIQPKFTGPGLSQVQSAWLQLSLGCTCLHSPRLRSLNSALPTQSVPVLGKRSTKHPPSHPFLHRPLNP